MDQRDDAELAELAALLRERNAIDARLGRLLDRPAIQGHIGEWIAARVFDIELEEAANKAGYDGRFATGELLGKSFNIKAYGKAEGSLDINTSALPDYFLVFTGRRATASSSRGALRPFCIHTVFLFDAHQLHGELVKRGVRICEATSVRATQWESAEIYPRQNNSSLMISEGQRAQLGMFACE